jgi:hypothetical protein
VWGVEWPELLAAAVVGILGVARLTRLVVDDDWPPVVWARRVWDRIWNQSPWVTLIECPWCVSPYIAAANIGWAVLSDLHWSWWLFNGWLAVSWVAAFICLRDIPVESR